MRATLTPRISLGINSLCRASWHRQGSTSQETWRDQSTSTANSAIEQERHDGERKPHAEEEEGAMSRRLEQLTEEALESGGRSARHAVDGAGFDESLRKRLEQKIASASLSFEHPIANAQVGMPKSAGRATRHIAGAQPWDGTESVQDSALRMLTDAHKPLNVSSDGSATRKNAPKVVVPALSSRRQPASVGARIGNAKNRSSVYSSTKDLSEEEQEQYRNELKQRFTPLANSLPATLAGISSLANQRIEDAIARGQFKNLPRGKPAEVDYHANSPFIDTTEYIMNKMMKKQDIKHEWIEKQQEIDTAVRRFRAQLRADWRRHAARAISSKGGSLIDQIHRAEVYAAAERGHQALRHMKHITANEDGSQFSQISLSGELKRTPEGKVSDAENVQVHATDRDPRMQILPFRDMDWENAEKPYHIQLIKTLNDMVRSYNLIAPQPSKRVYFNLKRELDACYAESAALIGDEIHRRAMQPKAAAYQVRSSPASVPFLKNLDHNPAKVYDENIQVKGYGMREFWKDLWGK